MGYTVAIVGMDSPEFVLLADDHCEYRVYAYHHAATGRWSRDVDDEVDDVFDAINVLVLLQ
jgi:hypothetical protein